MNLTGGLYIEACLGVSEDSYTSLHSRKKSCALVNKGEPCPTGLNLAFLKKNIAITCQLRNSLRTRGVRDGPTNWADQWFCLSLGFGMLPEPTAGEHKSYTNMAVVISGLVSPTFTWVPWAAEMRHMILRGEPVFDKWFLLGPELTVSLPLSLIGIVTSLPGEQCPHWGREGTFCPELGILPSSVYIFRNCSTMQTTWNTSL